MIQRDQPYGSHVKDLFEVQRYPKGDPPYDVAGWTLPFLLGVQRVEVVQQIDADLERVSDPARALAAFPGDPRVGDGEQLSAANSDDWRRLVAALGAGESYRFVHTGPDAGLFVPNPSDNRIVSMDEPGEFRVWSLRPPAKQPVRVASSLGDELAKHLRNAIASERWLAGAASQ